MADAPASNDSTTRPGLALGMLAVAFAIGQATLVNDGTFAPAAFGWLTAGIVLAVTTLLIGVRVTRFTTRHAELVGFGLTIIQISLLGVFGIVGWMGTSPRLALVLPCLGVAALGLTLAYVNRKLVGTSVVLIAFLVLGAATVRAMPLPGIDVWHFQQQSAQSLLQGENPYTARYKDVYPGSTIAYGPGVVVDGYLTYSFPYPPLSVLMVAPGRLFGDVRWAHVVALGLAGWMLASSLRGRLGAIVATMILFQPRVFLLIQTAWTESLLILMLVATVSAMLRRSTHSWVATGLMLAVKQYTVIWLPLLWVWTGWKSTLKALAVAAIVTLPFLLWGPTSFVRSVAVWQLIQPFRPDALSYPALWFAKTNIQPPVILAFIAMAMGLGFGVWKSPRTLGGLLAAMTVTMLLFVAFNKQAFCNYYALIAALAAMSGGVLLDDVRMKNREKT
ncbi:MAG: hypothetical protein QM770_00035 [Tepidisphaeraceae bacterium]